MEKVTDPGPSVGKLQVGDAIDAVNGTPVANVEEFTSLLKATKPGQEIVIDYRRKNAPPGTAPITLGTNPDRDYGYLGVAVLDAPWAPFTIDFNLANIGGPSAGLMFSLAVIDKLTTGDLNGSKFVAGTGTIDAGRQGRPDRRHHPQDAGRPGGRGDGVPGARRQLRRGQVVRARRSMELVKVDTLRQRRRRAADVDLGWRSAHAASALLADGPPRRCVELWPYFCHSAAQPPDTNQELTGGYAARRQDAEADSA